MFGPDDPISEDASRAAYGDSSSCSAPTPAPMPARSRRSRPRAEDLRRRFTEQAVAAHQRDRLDGAGDERKRRILEGDDYADLGRLSAIDLLPGGKYAGLQQKLTDLKTCKTFDPALLSRQRHLP